MEPYGRYTADAGPFFQLDIARSAAGNYQLAFDVVSDYYFRDLNPYTWEFSDWEFEGVVRHGTVSVTLHIIPDAAASCLFGTGLSVLPLLAPKKRQR